MTVLKNYNFSFAANLAVKSSTRDEVKDRDIRDICTTHPIGSLPTPPPGYQYHQSENIEQANGLRFKGIQEDRGVDGSPK